MQKTGNTWPHIFVHFFAAVQCRQITVDEWQMCMIVGLSGNLRYRISSVAKPFYAVLVKTCEGSCIWVCRVFFVSISVILVEGDASIFCSRTSTARRFWRMITDFRLCWHSFANSLLKKTWLFLHVSGLNWERPWSLQRVWIETWWNMYDSFLCSAVVRSITRKLACQPSGVYYAPAYGTTLDPYLEWPFTKELKLQPSIWLFLLQWEILGPWMISSLKTFLFCSGKRYIRNLPINQMPEVWFDSS